MTDISQDEVGILVNSAMAAPSIHNTEPPWRFEISGPAVDVMLDQDRTLPADDPAGRFTRIGIGAATFNLRVAAAMLGYETTFAIDPDPARPEIVARVFLGELQPSIPPLGNLYCELRRRQSDHEPMMTTELSPNVLGRVTEAARAEGADLHWLDADERAKLGRILRKAAELNGLDEDHLTERAPLTGGDRTSDAISDAVFEELPLIAILTTTADGPSEWVRAGMGLQHALLTATSYDMALSFLNQALEYAQLRLLVQDLVGHERPQVILNVGHPAQEGGAASRRQAVTDRH
jgi:hypothetical protein